MVDPGCQMYPPSPYQVCGAIKDKYNALGGASSFLLWPTSVEIRNPDGVGVRQTFVNGPVYWHPQAGAHPVANHFFACWQRNGWEGGVLKYPTTDEIVNPDGLGRRQEFQGGTIYWRLNEAYYVTGAIRDKWNQLGPLPAERSYLGYPSSDEIKLPDGVGRMNRFEGGVIYWHPQYGTHPVNGRILTLWGLGGYERSQWGYPIGDATTISGDPGALRQNFQRGSIYVKGDYLRSLLRPVNDDFPSYETGLHPLYCPDPLNSPPSCPVDLSDYNTVPDPLNQVKPVNYQQSAVVDAYFQQNNRPNASALWNHYYRNTGDDYVLSTSLVDSWTAETTTGYPLPPPATPVAANREDAIQRAIAEADSTGQRAKVLISTPWNIIAGSSADHVQSLGKYSLCSTTAVIAYPGSPGQHQIKLRQETHIFDVYDFAAGDDYGDPAQIAINVGVQAEQLGIAKPFLTTGSGSQKNWTGLR